MARFLIPQSIVADGVPFKAGDEVDGDEIEPGCLVSMLRLGQAKPLEVAQAKTPDLGQGKPPELAGEKKQPAKK